MNILLSFVLSVEFDKTTKRQDILELGEKVKNFMKFKNYSDLVEEVAIEILCVSKGFDQFFVETRPKYVEHKSGVVDHVLKYQINKSLMFNLKVDYESFYHSDKEEGLRIIAQAILKSLETLKYPVKLKKFDKLGFYNDMKTFFINEGLVDVNS